MSVKLESMCDFFGDMRCACIAYREGYKTPEDFMVITVEQFGKLLNARNCGEKSKARFIKILQQML